MNQDNVEVILPPLDMIIYLNIEYNHESNTIWSISVKLGDIERVYFAEVMQDEDLIINQFVLFLHRHPFFPLVCFAKNNYDFKILASKFDRYPILAKAMQGRAWIDLAMLLHVKNIIRANSKLQSLAVQYGYPLKEYTNGNIMHHLYKTSVSNHGYVTTELKQQFLRNCLDKIRILPYLLEKMMPHITIQEHYWGPIDFTLFADSITSLTLTEDHAYVQTISDGEKIAQELMKLGLPLPSEVTEHKIMWIDPLALQRWFEIEKKNLFNLNLHIINS